MWYDHPNWWQWLILIGLAVFVVFVWWGSTGGTRGGIGADNSTDDDGREMH